jgi:ABC-2 type transport system permease protein
MIVRHLLAHELRLLTRSRTAPTALFLMALTTAYGAYDGACAASERHSTHERIRRAQADIDAEVDRALARLASRGDPRPALELAGMAWYLFQPEGAVAPAPHIDPRRPEAAASEWVGARYALLPDAPLAALAVGQSDLHPSYSRVSIRTRPVLTNADEIENPINLLSGRFDLAFALTFCWPLLVLPLLYNVLSEDRENGTLGLVASQPVSRRRLIAARVALRVGAAATVTVVTAIGVLLVCGAVPGGYIGTATLAWTIAVAATAAFWTGLALAANVTHWRSATNAVALTACWLGSVVIAPAVIGEVAGALRPVPSRVELLNEIRIAGNIQSGELNALMTAFFEAYPDISPTRTSADTTALRGLAQQEAVNRRIDPIVARYRSAIRDQERLVQTLSYLVPPLLVHEALTNVAGTATARCRRFAEALDEYHRQWTAYYAPLVHARVSMTSRHYAEAPRFVFTDDQPGWRGRAGKLLAAVVAAGLGLMTVALWFVPRSSVLRG